MDSPLAPVLAKVFMGFYESQWLDEYNLNKPNFFYDMLMTLKLLFTTKKIHEFFKICQIIGILILNLWQKSKFDIPLPFLMYLFQVSIIKMWDFINLSKIDLHRTFSHHIKNKLSRLCKKFSKENFNIKLVFNSLKIKNYFSDKNWTPNDLKSFIVYKSTCARCSSS